MSKHINYTAVGLFVIGLIAAGIAIFFWLSMRAHHKQYDPYTIYLHEEVSGLTVQSVVRYNGVPVGFVKHIGLVPSNPQLVKVMVDIEAGSPVNTSTVATLMPQGITGVDYIDLHSELVNAPPLESRAGEKYPVIPSKPSFLVQLSEVIPEVTRKISELSDSISELFNAKNRTSISTSLQNLQVFTAMLKDNSDRMTESMKSLQELLKQGQIASKDLPELMLQSKTTLNTLDETLVAARSTFSSSTTAINNMSQQVIPDAQQAMQKLTNVATNLATLSNELQRNPSMLVRGKTPAQSGPGEK